jgi:hypothetical protein
MPRPIMVAGGEHCQLRAAVEVSPVGSGGVDGAIQCGPRVVLRRRRHDCLFLGISSKPGLGFAGVPSIAHIR